MYNINPLNLSEEKMNKVGKNVVMKENSKPVVELQSFGSSSTVKPVEIHNGKIVPQKENHPFPGMLRYRENEWQQEYFIIYNSYVLEQSDN